MDILISNQFPTSGSVQTENMQIRWAGLLISRPGGGHAWTGNKLLELGPIELQLVDLYVEWFDDIGSADCFTLSLKVSRGPSLWKPGRLKHGSG